jgi:hypothetical protein
MPTQGEPISGKPEIGCPWARPGRHQQGQLVPHRDALEVPVICLNATGILAAVEHQQNGKQKKKSHDAQGGHSITLSARASMDGGISMPRAFAVVRFAINSKRVGRSAGISDGWVPCNTLRNMPPACR